jgi:hypothetical protein
MIKRMDLRLTGNGEILIKEIVFFIVKPLLIYVSESLDKQTSSELDLVPKG